MVSWTEAISGSKGSQPISRTFSIWFLNRASSGDNGAAHRDVALDPFSTVTGSAPQQSVSNPSVLPTTLRKLHQTFPAPQDMIVPPQPHSLPSSPLVSPFWPLSFSQVLECVIAPLGSPDGTVFTWLAPFYPSGLSLNTTSARAIPESPSKSRLPLMLFFPQHSTLRPDGTHSLTQVGITNLI